MATSKTGTASYQILYFQEFCFVRAEEIEADSDLEAAIIASRRAGPGEFELWRGEKQLRPLPDLPPKLA